MVSKKKKNAKKEEMYTTSCGSTVVTHLSTRQTDSGLTSQIGRDAVLFTTYGRIQRLRERNTGIERRVKNEKNTKAADPSAFCFLASGLVSQSK